MKDINYIIRKGRFRITLWDLYFIGIVFFAIIALLFVTIWILDAMFVAKQVKYTLLICSFVILVLVSFLYFKTLLDRISFDYYVNNSSKTIESIILEISEEFSLDLYKKNLNAFYSYYYLPFRYWKLKEKKDVYLIFYDNTIMINIRNSEGTTKFSFLKDRKELEIKKALELKTNQTLIENFDSPKIYKITHK